MMPNFQANFRAPGMGGPGGGLVSSVPPDTYTCHRCGQKGHYKRHCPTNDNKDFDELNGQGITADGKWKNVNIGPESFQKKMNATMQCLVKNAGALQYTQDDITSLSLYPHYARPTTSGVDHDINKPVTDVKFDFSQEKKEELAIEILQKLRDA